jgi:NAD+-dependent protein deacetylase sirtuin 4
MELERLVALLRGRRVVAVVGAGCSTESGIPDYRGSGSRVRARSPIQYGEFVGKAEARQRYWARSVVGWPRLAGARPNTAHVALARLEAGGAVAGVITQNVDGLHHAAGSRRVIELHGSLGQVCCLVCGAREARAALQDRLVAENDAWLRRLTTRGNGGGSEASPGAAGVEAAPDGDAELTAEAVADFRAAACEGCGGMLKPDVVLFGESVPKERVAEAWRLFDGAEVVLVLGSSLAVFSGRRFVDRAARDGIPIGIINLGPTRADAVAAVKVEERLGAAVPAVADALGIGDRPAWTATGPASAGP